MDESQGLSGARFGNFVQGFIVIASFLIPCCEAGITEKHAAGNCHCFIVVLVVSPVCFFLSYTFTFNIPFCSEAQLIYH